MIRRNLSIHIKFHIPDILCQTLEKLKSPSISGDFLKQLDFDLWYNESILYLVFQIYVFQCPAEPFTIACASAKDKDTDILGYHAFCNLEFMRCQEPV